MKKIIRLAAVLAVPFFFSQSIAAQFTDVPYDPWDGYQYVDKLYSEGLIEGFPDATFRGNQALTRYELAVVMSRLVDRLLIEMGRTDPPVLEVFEVPATGDAEMIFADIPPEHWAYQHVMKLENLGIVIGMPGEEFDGNKVVTKIELAVMFNRLIERLPEYFNENPYGSSHNTIAQFTDIPENHWAFNDLSNQARLGIIDGFPEGSFRAGSSLTRFEMLLVMSRIIDYLMMRMEDAQIDRMERL